MQDQPIIQQWIDYAQKLAAQGRLDEAFQALQKVVEEAPQDLPVRAALIELALRKKDYQTVVAQHMDCAELLWRAGDRDASMGRYEKVLRLEEVVQPGYPQVVAEVRRLVAEVKAEIYLRIGEFRLEQQQPEQALQYLKKSQELKPGIWETHLALGRAYLATQAHKEAIGELQEVLRLSQDDQASQAQAYQLLGEVFVAQQRSAAATITWFERAAQLWMKEDRFEQAFQTYQRIVEVDPTNTEALESLATLSTRLQLSPGQPTPPDLQVKGHFPAEEPQVVRIFKRRAE